MQNKSSLFVIGIKFRNSYEIINFNLLIVKIYIIFVFTHLLKLFNADSVLDLRTKV